MELFSEIYSSYYRAVEEVLRMAQEKPLSGGEIQKILSDNSFSESAFTIFPKLQSGNWPLIRKSEGGYVTTCVPPAMNPLTELQKAWIIAILNDPRIHLFFDEVELEQVWHSLTDAEPLYRQEDFHLYDKALDNDDYDNPEYRKRFRIFLAAVRQKSALFVRYEGGKGKRVSGVFRPFKLEYSQKDDKFRAYCYRKTANRKTLYTLNLGRVVSAELIDSLADEHSKQMTTNSANPAPQFRQVVIEITKERNAIERCMVHFAHFEKRTEYDEAADKYVSTIRYHVMDEAEVAIRVLSFGPTIRVVAPNEFINEIKSRIKKQSELIQLRF